MGHCQDLEIMKEFFWTQYHEVDIVRAGDAVGNQLDPWSRNLPQMCNILKLEEDNALMAYINEYNPGKSIIFAEKKVEQTNFTMSRLSMDWMRDLFMEASHRRREKKLILNSGTEADSSLQQMLHQEALR